MDNVLKVVTQTGKWIENEKEFHVHHFVHPNVRVGFSKKC